MNIYYEYLLYLLLKYVVQYVDNTRRQPIYYPAPKKFCTHSLNYLLPSSKKFLYPFVKLFTTQLQKPMRPFQNPMRPCQTPHSTSLHPSIHPSTQASNLIKFNN